MSKDLANRRPLKLPHDDLPRLRSVVVAAGTAYYGCVQRHKIGILEEHRV